jgi:hypothetical protein
MRALIANWLWLLVFVSFGLGFIFAGWSNKTPTQQQTERTINTKSRAEEMPSAVSQSHAEHAPQAEEKVQHPIWSWVDNFFELNLTDVIIAIFTVVLAIKTSGLFVETAGLRSAADKQSRDMQASIKAATEAVQNGITANQIAVVNAERQLMAYVTASHVHVTEHRMPSSLSARDTEVPGRVHTYEFSVVLKNGGQTPAINVITNLNIMLFESHIPNDFDFPSSDRFGHGLIGPQVEWRTPWQQMTAEHVEETSTMLALWGWVEYDDIFTSSGSTLRHRTEFCFRIDRRHLPVTHELWMDFIPHYRFNGAEGDCLRSIDPATGEGGG